MPQNHCPVCRGPMKSSLQHWRFFCSVCAYEQSNLLPTINEHAAHEQIDEVARETGLRELRLANFKILLKAISQLQPAGGRLLDVGCAHGWFVETAMTQFDVLGIEPARLYTPRVLRVAFRSAMGISLKLCRMARRSTLSYSTMFSNISRPLSMS